jgi:hypothetical protein
MVDVTLGAYCRDIEAHLCRVNGGHLVRIVGPAFDMVKRWHAQGVPLKVVLRGVERRADRAARARAAARRPLRLEFCEADVYDVFDEWRRAVGFALGPASGHAEPAGPASDAAIGPSTEPQSPRGPSLPKHLERIAIRLTSFLATATEGDALRGRVEALLAQVDALRTGSGASRGQARRDVIDRLAALENDLLAYLPEAASAAAVSSARTEALDALAAYTQRLPDAEFARLLDVATRRLLRDRLGLPRLAFP